eukprot:12322712-Ditylum_brightwellii.AAC.1
MEIGSVKKSRFKHFSRALPKFVQHMRTWGKAGMINMRKKTNSKIEDHGVTCMMVGYATKHEGNCYE